MKSTNALLVAGLLSLGLAGSASAAMDDEAAKVILKRNDCTKCHAVDKTKKGPAYKKVAAKYKGKPEGEQKAIDNMTKGYKVKLEDGTEEDHKIIDTKDPAELKGLAQWILAR
jgi:cytochrome c